MHCLITGGAGFVGSHLAELLLAKGYQVTVIDDLSTGRLENVEHLRENPNFSVVVDSILNEIALDRVVSQADVIYHLAAAVGVQFIVENPIHTIETNLNGTQLVLETGLRYGTKVLIASTSEVYGKSPEDKFKEDSDVLLGPTKNNRWAYAASKMMDEFHALAYHNQRKLPVVIFRLFNTIGPRQTGQYGMVVPRFVTQALKNEPITVYGDGEQRRSFTWVRDAVGAMSDLAEHPDAVGQVFNIGHIKDISIYELAELVRDLVGSSSAIIKIPYDKAYAAGFEDMSRRMPDISKIKALTSYAPSIELPEMILQIIDHEKGQANPQG